MVWLVLGVVYSTAYAVVGWLLRDQSAVLSWFRAFALLIPPITGAVVIVRRRHTWAGCQWLFWSTIALGLAMSAIGLTGWAADELVLGHGTWLAWPSIFALFGSVAPLFALLAQPHRGPREPLAATTAVDIAGLAVVTGFLYSFFVTAPSSAPLLIVSEGQQALVVLAMAAAMFAARRTEWRGTYRRLALGALVSFVTLTMSNVEARQGIYRSAFVYDFTWILPFAFFPWAATEAPASESESSGDEDKELTRPRPWVIFIAVALLPFLDFALRHVAPDEANQSFRDLSTAIAIVSVLPLLVARIAAERAELQQAGSTMKLLVHVFEQSQDLILVLTPDGRCRHANSAFCRAMGLTPDELTHLRGRDLMVRDGVSADDIQAVVRAGGTWRGTVTRTRRDGTTFTSSATVAALLDDKGGPMHIVSVERDISEERRLKEQLIHSERLSAVGQLVAGVAHELNNPLQGLMGLTELLINAETRPETRRDLEHVRHDGERAATIVRNLLAFARRSALERSVADLNEIGRSSIALRAYELTLAGTALRTEYADDLPMVVVNREEIQQVVINLIINAEHALRAHGGAGTITLRTTLDGDVVRLEVSDDGPGVPGDLAGRIFEPFFTTKGVGEGTGLGLSVSLGIAQAHNGSLELLPSARGACFALTLPTGIPHQAVMAASKSDASSSGPA